MGWLLWIGVPVVFAIVALVLITQVITSLQHALGA